MMLHHFKSGGLLDCLATTLADIGDEWFIAAAARAHAVPGFLRREFSTQIEIGKQGAIAVQEVIHSYIALLTVAGPSEQAQSGETNREANRS